MQERLQHVHTPTTGARALYSIGDFFAAILIAVTWCSFAHAQSSQRGSLRTMSQSSSGRPASGIEGDESPNKGFNKSIISLALRKG